MITPSHRAAILRQVEGAAARLYPATMKTCIVSAWCCAGYDRSEVEEIVYGKEEINGNPNTAQEAR